MQTRSFTQIDYAQAVAALLTTMPVERGIQVYEYALFLQARSQNTDKAQDEIEADETWWDAQFAATDDSRLAAFVESAMAEDGFTGISIESDGLVPSEVEDAR